MLNYERLQHMPANFTETEKQEIFGRLYDEGYTFLKKAGLKNLNIRALAKATGIATGTFYNFFPSKEEFIFQLILKKRNESFDAFTSLAKNYPQGIPYEEACNFFYQNLKNNNIYQYLSADECNMLINKFQPKANEQSTLTAEFIMSKLATNKGIKEYALFNQSYNILIIGTSDISKINTSVFDDTLKPMVAAACRILY